MDSSSRSKALIKRLMNASSEGNLPLLKTLAQTVDKNSKGIKKTLADCKNDEHQSVLHFAAAGGQTKTCQFLVDDLELDIDVQDDHGETPLLNAIAGGHSSTTKYFLEKGARLDLANSRGFSPLDYLADKDSSETAVSSSGSCTAEIFDMLTVAAFRSKHANLACKTYGLIFAASKGDVDLLTDLAEEIGKTRNGIRQTIVGFRYAANGRSLLHVAAKEGKGEVCQYLIDQFDHELDVRDTRGETPLLYAIKQGHNHVASILIKKGASCDLSNDRDFSPIHYAAEKGDSEVLKLLLSKEAKVNAISCIGTPLQIAASQGKHEGVKILLDNKGNVNICPDHVHTPLLGAIAAKSLECVKALIAADANVNTISCGVTALYLAASEGETEIVKTLLIAGADPSITAKDGHTPIETAAINSHNDVVQILFPVTSPISTYSNWSLMEIISLASEEKATEQRKLKAKEKLLEMKKQGDLAVSKKAYGKGIFWYTKCLDDAEPSEAAVALSKRSQCWAEMGFGNCALIDAHSCKGLKPDWHEAYYRAGAAWNVLRRFDKAAVEFMVGLKMNFPNEELHNAAKEALEANQASMKKRHP